VALEKDADDQPFHRAHRAIGAARFRLARYKAENGITAQLVVIVQILVAKRDAMNALGNQRFDRELHAVLHAVILETGRRLQGQADVAIGFPQEQGARVRRDGAPSKAAVTFRLPRLAKSKGS